MSSSQTSDDEALLFLSTQGWLPLVLADHPGFVDAYAALFDAATAFFALPEDSKQKTDHQAASGALASEEGYSQIPDEKSILTLKVSTNCPPDIEESARRAWNLTGTLLSNILQGIATTLGLKPDVFTPFVDPCKALPEKQRTPTLLRMFRYDRPTAAEEKVNAERHRDLGLLSLVIGHSPGLQVLNLTTNLWIPVEEDAFLSPGARTRSGGLTACLLGGQTLAFLSRDQYRAGEHRVVCVPPSPAFGNDPYRYSIVFTLRPAAAPVFTKYFESEITGCFPEGEKAEGESSAALFQRIRGSHWNVNASPDIREKQREEQRRKAEKT